MGLEYLITLVEQDKQEPINFYVKGNKVMAQELASIPVRMFRKRHTIKTHVLDSYILLLMSRQTMKELDCVIEICQNKVFAKGGEKNRFWTPSQAT